MHKLKLPRLGLNIVLSLCGRGGIVITPALIGVISEMEWKKGIELCTYQRHICKQFSTSRNEVLKPEMVGQSQTRAENIAANSVKE